MMESNLRKMNFHEVELSVGEYMQMNCIISSLLFYRIMVNKNEQVEGGLVYFYLFIKLNVYASHLTAELSLGNLQMIKR